MEQHWLVPVLVAGFICTSVAQPAGTPGTGSGGALEQDPEQGPRELLMAGHGKGPVVFVRAPRKR